VRHLSSLPSFIAAFCYSAKVSRSELTLFRNTRHYSSLAVLAAAIASTLLSGLIDNSDITWQVFLAIFALALGIPHGSLDHLVSLPKANAFRMALFISLYLAVAVLAVWALLSWNVYAFWIVVLMSALHFGIGDAAFISEGDSFNQQSRASRGNQILYALAAGSLPVVLPLIQPESVAALSAVNPVLVNWHQGFDRELGLLVLSISFLAALSLVLTRRWRDLLDLSALFALALLAPPLVAFAVYFGTWHAMRHTARLTLNLPRSQSALANQRPLAAFWSAIWPGLPALLATFSIAAVIGFFTPEKLNDEFLWFTLVMVWALTVPHMIVTAKLDKAALR
jgi:Brp/Blh family beta-carotene 15,15'-monooxygenase